MRSIEFATGEYYHIFNRGVDKRNIFSHSADYWHFSESMFAFNDANYHHTGDPFGKILKLSGHEVFEDQYDPFVKIIAFTLMPNHYHFFVQQLKDEGISRFLHKLNMGHTHYYNKNNNRSGALFESTFKAKHINKSDYFSHILVYTHLNILDLSKHDWRNGNVQNWDEAQRFMDAYRWSSHVDYQGLAPEFPLIKPETISEFFQKPQEYQQALRSWSMRSIEGLLAT